MPDSRPLSTLRAGRFDVPVASTGASFQQRLYTRRRTLDRSSYRAPAESPLSAPLDALHSERTRVLQNGSMSRRRRRSESTHDVEEESTPEAPGRDASRSRRRHKRRRLNQSPPPPEVRKPIKYGHFGQVEAGRLKLELVSCDGGEHKDPRSPEDLGPQNILRHDKSVYCSERHCVNIVLRHADDTPFCLEKLHIVGPEHGFTAPVRGGLVYVAMTMADLLLHIDTASTPPPVAAEPRNSRIITRLRVRNHLDSSSSSSTPSSPEGGLTLANALRDPAVNAALTERHPANLTNAPPSAEAETEEDYYGTDFGFGRTDSEGRCDVPSFPFSPPHEAGRDGNNHNTATRPITLLSDEEPGPEDVSPPAWLDYRLQRLRNMRRRLEVEAWDREEYGGAGGLNRNGNLPPERSGGRDWNLRRLDALMARSRVDSTTPPASALDVIAAGLPQNYTPLPTHRRNNEEPSQVEGEEEGEGGSQVSQPTPCDDVDSKDGITAAKFRIQKGKYKVALKFEPAVSGRFVLLKLWSRNPKDEEGRGGEGGGGGGGGNVDVQSVIAMGFGGGRYFPAKCVR